MFKIFDGEPNTPEEIFDRNKQESEDFVESYEGDNGHEKEGGIDQGILELVKKINALPFLHTHIGSCEGHISKIRGRYYPGYINFVADESQISKKFLKELATIVATFPNASIRETEPFDHYGKHITKGYGVDFDDRDKNGKIFPKDEALGFLTETRKLIGEIEDLADKYNLEQRIMSNLVA